ncbi:YjbQ family protein [Vibrio sp. E150_011]
MELIFNSLNITTAKGRPSYHDLTSDLSELIRKSGVVNGVLTATTPHTTCSFFFEEEMHDLDSNGDDFLQLDFNATLDRIAPIQATHNQFKSPGPEHIKFGLSLAAPNYPAEKWVMYNTDAHIRASMFGQHSLQVIVKEGKALMGALGRVYFADWDTLRERQRDVNVVVMGVV